MVKIREAIVVEGRYDKNMLSQIVDTVIFQTDGFAIRRNYRMVALLRQVAQTRGLIVLTDSDSAGFMIRNFLKMAIPKEHLKHAYIPDIYGKERRKTAPGKEGKLGVEGMTPDVIIASLHRAGATFWQEAPQKKGEPITKTDLYFLGLSGTLDSRKNRLALQKKLDLPEHMSANALLEVLNLLYTKEQLYILVHELLDGEEA